MTTAAAISGKSRDSLATVSMLEQGNRGTGEQTSSSEPDELQLPLDRPDVAQLCTHLADRVTANTGKTPTITKKWRDAARLLLDKDLAHESDPLRLALRLADWATNDEFWRTNILSMPTFRDQFQKLRLKARRDWEQKHRAEPEDRIAGWQSLKTGTEPMGVLYALPGGDPPS